jgi:hypothetical protein
MAGQGRPHRSLLGSRPGLIVRACWCLLLTCGATLWAQEAPPNPELIELELRIAIGGGAPQAWRGSIAVEDGDVALVRVLGLEPDTPGAARSVNGRLEFQQRSPHGYDGFDVVVRGPRSGKLRINIASQGEPQHIEVPLGELINGVNSSALDDQQNRLLVRRTPGDKLRVLFERDNLVFDTGETFTFSVQPHEAGLPTDTQLRCRVRLLNAGDAEIWNTETDFRIGRDGAAPTLGPFACPLPAAEGVYRATIEIIHPPRLGVALVRTKPLLARDVQLVAISLTPPEPDDTPFANVLEIDPAHPGWLDRLTRLSRLPSIPGFANKEPLDNKKSSVVEHHGAKLVQLGTGGWQAYPLPLKNIGAPHVLEVEFPRDASQSLGISIVEPNAAGHVAPLGVDSGVIHTATIGEAASGMLKHRLVFWPKTKTPLVLLTNRDTKQPALYGKLRVLAGPRNLPSQLADNEPRGRLVAAYYDKPLFAENFGAGEALDAATSRTLDDWNTFYLGARRMIEELKFAGYNGAVISVVCEGSALYPSQLLEPTPKYDMGQFFATGQDPLRKDVVEMLFRLFDREGLQLVPAVQFATPLVELEQHAADPEEGLGLTLIGPEGKPYAVVRGTRRGIAPYYNPLDERVRRAMRHVVDEIASRYGHHEAFAGVSLQLSPDTFAQLPGEEWGYDDVTIRNFARESKKSLPNSGPTRFAQRARQLQGPDREVWLAWRAKQMSLLYTSIERDLLRHRGNARLFLAGGEMLHSEALERSLRPALPPHAKLREALLSIGFDPQLLQGHSNLVFLRPQREFAPGELASKAAQIELNRSTEFDDLLARLTNPGMHWFHEPATLRLPEFDAASPFGADKTHLFLAAQLARTGSEARKAFVRSLAAYDATAVASGGWMLPLGQEEATRDIFAVYRSLPPQTLERIENESERTQPLIVRQAAHEGRTYALLINPSPWPLKVNLELSDPDGGAWLALGGRALPAGSRVGDKQTIAIELAAYDLFAIASENARGQVSGWQVTLPPTANDQLRRAIDDLRARAIALRSVKPLDRLANADFEQAVEKSEPPGWIHATTAGVSVGIESHEARDKQALRIASTGPDAWVRSEPFAAPATGRLSVWVWLKVKDEKSQPPLRLAIEGRHRDKTYYRFASVGAGAATPPLKNQWAPYLFQVDDLPTSDFTDLRVGFDLMGKGEVWIDDVQIFDAYFQEPEQEELLKTIALADLHLGQGRVGDCQRLLDGYWPRFLAEHVAAAPAPVKVSSAPKPPSPAPDSTDQPKQSVKERVWNWVPKWR